jgi:hypothetical protein
LSTQGIPTRVERHDPSPAGRRLRMRCPRCQHENALSMKFCGECESPLVAICSACGTANAPAQVLRECWAPLGLG